MSDLIKQRSGGAKPTFSLPQIFPKPSFSKLSDLTNFHLGGVASATSGGTAAAAATGFVIPKLGLQPTKIGAAAATNVLTPHELSLKKIMDLKNIRLTEQIEVKTAVVPSKIDLSTALRTANCVPIVRTVEATPTPFTPTYVDCETTSLMPTITQDCQIDISALFDDAQKPKRASRFGKTLCMRYRFEDDKVGRRRVKHEFSIRHQIRPYSFGHLSPDDLVLRTLNKLK